MRCKYYFIYAICTWLAQFAQINLTHEFVANGNFGGIKFGKLALSSYWRSLNLAIWILSAIGAHAIIYIGVLYQIRQVVKFKTFTIFLLFMLFCLYWQLGTINSCQFFQRYRINYCMLEISAEIKFGSWAPNHHYKNISWFGPPVN